MSEHTAREIIWWVLVIAAGVCFSILINSGVCARDRNVPAAFQRENPCPSTGKTTGACPGWERDHIVPLCRGGADTVANLQWLSTAQHKLKTRGDCRKLPG